MNVGGFFELDLATAATLVTALATLLAQLRSRRKVDELRAGQIDKAETIDAIEHEVKPNSGKSLRDAVDRIERNVEGLATTVARGEERDIEHSQRLRVLEDRGDRCRPFWRR